MSKIKNGGLDQYGGAEPFKQQQFGTFGVDGVNLSTVSVSLWGRSFVFVNSQVTCLTFYSA